MQKSPLPRPLFTSPVILKKVNLDMALEAVVYAQDTYSTYGYMDNWVYGDSGLLQEHNEHFKGILCNNINSIEKQASRANWDSSTSSVKQHDKDQWDPNSLSPEDCAVDQSPGTLLATMEEPPLVLTNIGRRKRRRTKRAKNKEEIENQRMSHIAVERNRRKQMNEYLAVMRSLMPPSYVQRGDQSSIIGGAINSVKELEQLVQTMECHKRRTKQQAEVKNAFSSPLAGFFSFPQYSTCATQSSAMADESVAETLSLAAADIEVTMVESHANLKILSKKRPRQLLKMVAGLQSLRLSILHLNVTAFDQMVLYSVSVKVEEGSHLTTVDEIAAAANQLLHRIEVEAVSAEINL